MSEAHNCEPDRYPSTPTEGWVCPECGECYRAFDVHAEEPDRFGKHVPPGTLGWTTRKVGNGPTNGPTGYDGRDFNTPD